MPENQPHLTAEPQETGGRPEQRAASQEEDRALVPSIEGETETSPIRLSERIGSIGQGGIRGQASSILLQAAISHIENEKSQLRSERDLAMRNADSYKERYYEEKENAAVLKSERDAAKTQIRLRTILLSVGALISGYGLRAIGEAATQPWAWPSAVVGCAMLLAGWLSPDPPQRAGKE